MSTKAGTAALDPISQRLFSAATRLAPPASGQKLQEGTTQSWEYHEMRPGRRSTKQNAGPCDLRDCGAAWTRPFMAAVYHQPRITCLPDKNCPHRDRAAPFPHVLVLGLLLVPLTSRAPICLKTLARALAFRSTVRLWRTCCCRGAPPSRAIQADGNSCHSATHRVPRSQP